MIQLENKIKKILENINYKNKLLNILKQYNIKKELINDDKFLIDTIMLNPSVLFKDITKIDITSSMLDFTNCINTYKLNDNRIIINNSINRNGKNLHLASNRLKNDYNIVFNAVNNNGLALEYASKKFRDNEKIVEKAIRNNFNSYYFASINMKNNYNIIKIFLIKNPKNINNFEYLSNFNKLIKDVIKENGLVLKYLNAKYKNNKTLVINACKNNVKSLQYASYSLLNNSEFLIYLAKKINNDQVIYYASNNLLMDKQFNIDIINKLDFNLYFIDDIYKDDIEVVEAAIRKDIRNLEHASKRIRTNPILMIELIKKYGPILRYAHKDLLNNKEFLYKAIKEYNGSIKYLTNDIIEDKIFLERISNINNWCKNYIKKRYLIS